MKSATRELVFQISRKPWNRCKPEMERSGMGFAFMEAFMDDLEVVSTEGEGTTVKMRKTIYSALNLS